MNPITNTDTAWQRAAEAGANTVREALKTRIQRRLARGDDPKHVLALLWGALGECAQGLRIAVDPNTDRLALERSTMALVRGALRGAEGPLNEDGSHYGDW